MKIFGKEVTKGFGKWALGAALAAGALGMGTAKANAAQVRVGIGFGVPVAAPVAYVPACPGPGYAWVGGYWGPRRVWVPGYWRGPRAVGPEPIIRGRVGFYDAHRSYYPRYRR
jgi:hypothetical protein